MLFAARQFHPRLRPGEAISHTSALLMHGCPLRIRAELHVTAQPTHARSRVRGVHGHGWDAPTRVTAVEGIPVSFPSTALLQSAGLLPLRELVVAIDHLVRPRGRVGETPPLLPMSDLRLEALRFRGRGATNLRIALELSQVGAESRMESLTRLVLYAYGLADHFSLQVEISDARGWIGRFDLVDRLRKVIVEFDGDQHRTDKTQYEKDLRRLDRARDAGYVVIRLLSDDVLHRPRATATRVAASLKVGLLPHPLRPLLLEFSP